MIDLQDILHMQNASIEDFGGEKGIRDPELLASALARPFQTFDGSELYPSVIEKAGALAESLIVNHPFVDGNKRIGFLAMFALLQEHAIVFSASEVELYDFIIRISTGALNITEIITWIRVHTKEER
ncbi:type II toxin-antitoxin system death-on-curing family toxin [Taibaiella koreensis]|uniref:type II toxin-antitoxin system death-on-curing family toxin n=1 Tax=Taibaiella koreensis TaxID=1268548 RepID=UPI000E59994D|nr:type II toxin-antitoxin system death-on-curing family toxin [Taibaiella koreensis]